MSRVLIFAGTTEGRELSEFLVRQRELHDVCAATEYGGSLLPEGTFRRVHAGRLNAEEMKELILAVNAELVVDATHPYAVEVSKNIRAAAGEAETEYLRLLRSSQREAAESQDLISVASVEEACEFLKTTTGNILATTGSKELAKYTVIPEYQTRVFARVLSLPEVVAGCAELGFTGKQLICMQGPFSEELNTAMLRQYDAKWLVTKEAGKSGGFEEKLRAARAAGASVVLIERPTEEEGLSLAEVEQLLIDRLSLHPKKTIAIVGIGMGPEEGMTVEAREVCRKADLLIGAERMLQDVKDWGIPTFTSYRPQEIADYVHAHPEYASVALLQSGDVGFYSGAKRLIEVFSEEEVRLYPGISSVVAFCAKLQTPWEDVCLASLHGRSQNILAKIRHHRKVFTLIGKGEGVRALCQKLCEYGFGSVTLSVGENLGYPDERIITGSAEELQDEKFADLCVVLIQNDAAAPKTVHGLPDEAFLRGKAPMTKSEVRAISISKLQLNADSVVYDVGAGTGSVSIEAALQAEDGVVYAIEKKEEAVELLRENKRRFAVDHLQIIEGLAPEAMRELPAPTHVFVGGSSGNLKEILQLVLEKNPEARIVINCIALETVSEALDCLKTLPLKDAEIVSVSTARSKEVGRYHMMMGQNPVYVISCTGGSV
ncbi:MAG: precorrin-6A reductase [Eubacteriales bacterium]|nr:precorrin-6A reductase [Eubacteriales bacterium]